MELIGKQTELLKTKILPESRIITEYEGTFEQSNIRSLSSILNKSTKPYPIAQKRLFYVFVELAQNVKFYSDEKTIINDEPVGVGGVVIYESEDKIGFIIGNMINYKAFKVLERKCKIINSLNRDSLRELKRYQRNLIPGTNGGAHIGIIMVSLTTRKLLEYYYEKRDDNSVYFILNVAIKKK